MRKEKPLQSMERSHLKYEVERIRRIRPTSCHANEPLKCLTSPLMQEVTDSLLRKKGITPVEDYGKKETKSEKTEYPTS